MSFAQRAARSSVRLDGGATIIFALTLAACASRLFSLHEPATPVYDETHVGRFLNWYHERAFFFDVHGPLAKLLMYWTATALGFDGRATCPYESTTPYAAVCTLAPQRLVPALCGACMVPLTFATCSAMHLHPFAALLCSYLVLVDTLWIGVSRIHLNDMVLMLFIAATHLFALRACLPPPPPLLKPHDTKPDDSSDGEAKQSHPNNDDADLDTSTRGSEALALCATGFALGCALQSKYAMALTTLAWLGLQNIMTLCEVAASGAGLGVLFAQAVRRGVLLLGIPVALHLSLLAVHLAYLPKTGNGDNYLSERFQSTLAGSKHEARFADEAPSFLELAMEHLRAQFWYNRNMAILFPRGSHPFDTPWYTWPLAARGIYFSLVADWQSLARDVGAKHSFGIFLHPNPMIVLTTTGAVAVAVAFMLARTTAALLAPKSVGEESRLAALGRLARTMRPGATGSLLVAYLLHWLPYATQDRQTFLVYYLPAYYFAILIFGRVWHAAVCTYLRPTVAALLSVGLAAWLGRVAWQLMPIAYGSSVRLHEWTDALRLASTECWGDEPCWVDVGAVQ